MKRAWLLFLASMLMAWSAPAQAPPSKTSDEPQGQKPSSEQSPKKSSGTKASGSASSSASSSTSAQAGQNSVNLSTGTTIEAALSSAVDARKNKEGDQVVARTTQAVKSDGQVVIPKGSRLVGHVTQAKAKAKGESQSALGIVFDRAVLKNGQEVPLHVVIQALAAAEASASTPVGAADTMDSAAGSGRAGSSGGGMVGGVGSTVGSTAGAVTSTAGAAGSTATGAVGATANTAASTTGAAGRGAAAALTSSSTGVIGLQGLALNSDVSSATQGSLIVSSTKNVHLDSGTRMVLRVAAQ
ncbi:MAG: hypothetical protein WAR21_14570 [Candidatus Acidiferrales bacterium]